MDPLTKKLMGRLGLTPGQSQLPPVNNLRMVTLQKDISEGEKDLHQARLRLQDLQAALENPPTDPNQPPIEDLIISLHNAMYKLQAREQDYFAMTRFTGEKNKPILDGWTGVGRRAQQLLLVKEILKQSRHHRRNTRGIISLPASRVLQRVFNMAANLDRAIQEWYDSGRRLESPRGVPEDRHRDIIDAYADAKQQSQVIIMSDRESTSSKIAVKIAMQRAERLKRISQSLKHGQWTVPVDDISPITP